MKSILTKLIDDSKSNANLSNKNELQYLHSSYASLQNC